MQMAMVARQMMTKNLVTLRPDMDVFDAIDTLLRKRISGAPVIDEDQAFVGIFSESSCMQVVLNAAYEGFPRAGLLPFIDLDPPTIDPETDLLTICQTFVDQRTRRLPVLEDGKLIGQISRRDVMRNVRDCLNRGQATEKSDFLYLSALGDDRAAITQRVR